MTEAGDEKWRFPVGYDLSVDQMRTLGLYISEPRSPQETDRPFPEPALFITNPEGKLQIVDVSNAPFARPELNAVIGSQVRSGKALSDPWNACMIAPDTGATDRQYSRLVHRWVDSIGLE